MNELKTGASLRVNFYTPCHSNRGSSRNLTFLTLPACVMKLQSDCCHGNVDIFETAANLSCVSHVGSVLYQKKNPHQKEMFARIANDPNVTS